MTLTNANTADSGGIGVCDTLNTSACYAGIYLRDAGNITLTNVDISGNTAEQAINGINVAGFTLSNSTISNCGNEVNESCVKMRDLTGTATLSGVDLSAAAAKVMEVHNDSGVLNLTVRDSTFRDTQSVSYTHLTLPTKRIV